MLYLDELVIGNSSAVFSALQGYLAGEGELAIGVVVTGGTATNVLTVTADLAIPAGKTVYILNGTTVDVATTFGIKIAGKLYVGNDAILQATSASATPGTIEVDGGIVHVLEGGTFYVKSDADANNGALFGASTVLGTNSVRFEKGATLKVKTLADTTAVQNYFDYLKAGTGNGILEVETITSANVKPSDLSLINGIDKDRKLKATATKEESASDLIILEGAEITAYPNDTLKDVTKLVVNGKLTALGSATLAGVNDLTVDGTLTVGNNVRFAGLATSGTASGSGELVMGDGDFSAAAGTLLSIKNITSAATNIAAPFTVPQGTTLTLTGATVTTAASATVGVDGKLVITGEVTSTESVTVGEETTPDADDGGVIEVNGATGKLTIATGKELNIGKGGHVNIVDAGSLVLTADTGGALLKGAGQLKAGSTVIVGGESGWQAAVGSGGTVAIKAGATAIAPNEATITGASTNAFTAVGAGATITQLAEPGNKLIIDTNTTIDLGGGAGSTTPAEIKGSLILTGHPTNPGHISLVNAGGAPNSIVTVVPTGGPTTTYSSSAKTIGGSAFQPTTGGPTPKRAAIYVDSTGLFGKMDNNDSNGGAANEGLKGGANSANTVTINATAVVAP
jgi:hypothetical protein